MSYSCIHRFRWMLSPCQITCFTAVRTLRLVFILMTQNDWGNTHTGYWMIAFVTGILHAWISKGKEIIIWIYFAFFALLFITDHMLELWCPSKQSTDRFQVYPRSSELNFSFFILKMQPLGPSLIWFPQCCWLCKIFTQECANYFRLSSAIQWEFWTIYSSSKVDRCNFFSFSFWGDHAINLTALTFICPSGSAWSRLQVTNLCLEPASSGWK